MATLHFIGGAAAAGLLQAAEGAFELQVLQQQLQLEVQRTKRRRERRFEREKIITNGLHRTRYTTE